MDKLFYKKKFVIICLLYLYHWKYFCICYKNENENNYGVDDDLYDYPADRGLFINNEFNVERNAMEIEAPCEFRDGGRICNCGFRDEKMVLPKMNGNIHQVTILNCKILRIPSETFATVSMIAGVTFTNIEDLILDEYALTFPRRLPSNRVQIEFTNTIIEEMSSHAINGNIDGISFINCKIGILRSFTISGIIQRAYKLSIRDTTINKIEPQAFKKFTVDVFEIINSTFLSPIPSRAIYDLEVDELFRISNCNFTIFSYTSFLLQDVARFSFQNNQIELLNGGSFQMKIKESIIIENNRIENLVSSAFQSITLDNNYFSRHSERLNFIFSSNTLDIAENEPLLIAFNSQFNIRLTKLFILKAYTCHSIEPMRNSEWFQQYSDTIFIRMPDFSDSDSDFQYHTFSYIINQKCIEQSYLIYIIVGVVILILILIVILCIVLILWKRRRNARKLNIVMPEPKTYRETQIIMQIENAGLLKTDM